MLLEHCSILLGRRSASWVNWGYFTFLFFPLPLPVQDGIGQLNFAFWNVLQYEHHMLKWCIQDLGCRVVWSCRTNELFIYFSRWTWCIFRQSFVCEAPSTFYNTNTCLRLIYKMLNSYYQAACPMSPLGGNWSQAVIHEIAHHFRIIADGCRRLLGFHLVLVDHVPHSWPISCLIFAATRAGLSSEC